MNQLSLFGKPKTDSLVISQIQKLETFGLDNTIIELIQSKDKDALKNLLINYQGSTKDKGDLFEHIMAYLYRYNGYLVKVMGGSHDQGADILLYHPNEPDCIATIVQCKNQVERVNKDTVRSELSKFEDEAKLNYGCSFYELVSVSGFVENVYAYERFNMSFKGWDFVCELVDNIQEIPSKTPPLNLRPHNKRSYQALCEQLNYTNRVCIVQATGTGKSYVLAQFMSDHSHQKGLLLAPTHYILNQFKEGFHWRMNNVKLMTYAKLLRLNKEAIKALQIDYCIVDEFHRTGAEGTNIGMESLFEVFPDIPVIGASATPTRHSDRRNMVDELFNSKMAFQLNLPDAIAKEIVRAPQYISALYSIDSDINEIEHTIHESDVDQKTKDKQLVRLHDYAINWRKGEGIHHVLKKHINPKQSKMVIFCKDVTHLKQMKIVVEQWFLDAFGINTSSYVVHSQNETTERTKKENEEAFQSFRDANSNKGIHLLFCVDMLNEGVHVSDVTGVILLRETCSLRIFYQQIGRCIQVSQQQQPIIFDLVNNRHAVGSGDFYNDIQQALRKENIERETMGLSKKDIQFQVTDYVDDFLSLVTDIEFNCSGWMSWFELYKTFKDKFNREPKNIEEFEGVKLGGWCTNLRTGYKKGKLDNTKIDLLNQAGFVWDQIELAWQTNFELYKAFKEEFNREPEKREAYEGVRLGIWVSTQRQAYKKGELDDTKIDLLNQVGFVWDPVETEWQSKFELYKTFKEKCNRDPKVKEEYEGVRLGEWVNTQRYFYKKGKLDSTRIDLLNQAGFVWDQDELKWQTNFELYKTFKEEFNKEPESSVKYEGVKLGLWVGNQRAAYKKGKLDDTKIDLLNKAGFVWKVRHETS